MCKHADHVSNKHVTSIGQVLTFIHCFMKVILNKYILINKSINDIKFLLFTAQAI